MIKELSSNKCLLSNMKIAELSPLLVKLLLLQMFLHSVTENVENNESFFHFFKHVSLIQYLQTWNYFFPFCTNIFTTVCGFKLSHLLKNKYLEIFSCPIFMTFTSLNQEISKIYYYLFEIVFFFVKKTKFTILAMKNY